MRKILIIILVILSFAFNAQPPSKFYTTIGREGDDVGYSAKQTLDGQYIIAGSSSSYGGNGSTDVYLTKIDSMGQPLWEKFYGGFGNEVGKSVIQLPDSGYVLAGFTNSFGAGGYDAYMLRTDKLGNMIWQKTFGGSDWDFAADLVLASDGNIFVVGNTTSFGNGKKDGFVIKYDLSGNLLLQKFIGGVENEELRSIIKTNDNFLATVGYTESKNDINGDGYFLKFDLNGDTVFTKIFGGAYKDFANDLVQKSNDDYILCGAKTFSINEKSKSYMYCFDVIGNFNWDNSYYASTSDENFVSVANSYQLNSLTVYLRNIPVPSFQQQGNLFLGIPGGWNYKVNSFGGENDEECFSIEGTKDGGFLILGSTLSFNSLGKDIYFLKQDSTCYNYTNIVSVKEQQKTGTPVIYNGNDKIFTFHFADGNIPENVSLFTLNGSLVWEFNPLVNHFDHDFFWLQNGVYVIRLQCKNGYYYNKIIIGWR